MSASSVRAWSERTRTLLATYPFHVAAAIALLAEADAVWRTIVRYAQPPMALDSAFFQHAGWYITTGAVPYLDIWDPKPPLAQETSAVLALVTSNPYRLHLLNVAFMIAVTVGIVLLVAAHVRRLTGDPVAAVVGGVSVFVLPGFFYRPALGFKPKYLIVCAGLLGIYLFYEGHYVASGAAAAAAAGYRQLAIIYPLMVLGLVVQQADRRALVRVLAGMAAVTLVAVVPIVLMGATTPMIVQVVVMPFLTRQALQLPFRLYMGTQRFKYGSVLVLAAGIGIWRFARSEDRRLEWWVLVGTAWYGVAALVFDFEFFSYTDLIPGLMFVAIGIGYLYGSLETPRSRQLLAGAVAAVLLVNVLALGSLGLLFPPVKTESPIDLHGPPPTILDGVSGRYSPAPAHLVDVRYLYWKQLPPDTCNYRWSTRELKWIHATGQYPNCGTDLGQAIDLLRHRGALPK